MTLRLAATEVAKAEALLTLAGAQTIALRDAADDPVLEPAPSTAPLWPHVVLEAQFTAELDLKPLQALLSSVFRDAGVAVAPVDESLWRSRVAEAIKPKLIGTRLWLAPADDEHVPAERRVVHLHMGLAFGTGEHPTTALCLDWLDRHVEPGTTVLDYGCGSGVLALAALALGARFAYAVDNDPQAVLATSANAALNGAAERMFVATPEALPAVSVDVLAANILAGPLIALAPTFARHVVAGGNVVLAGILERQAAEVAAAFAPYFDELAPATRDGWTRLVGRRKSG